MQTRCWTLGLVDAVVDDPTWENAPNYVEIQTDVNVFEEDGFHAPEIIVEPLRGHIRNNSGVMLSTHFNGSEPPILTLRHCPSKSSTKAKSARIPFGGQATKMHPIPAAVSSYNHHMNGVDIADQYRSYYASTRRNRRGLWKALQYNFLLGEVHMEVSPRKLTSVQEVACLNSFLLYQRRPKRVIGAGPTPTSRWRWLWRSSRSMERLQVGQNRGALKNYNFVFKEIGVACPCWLDQGQCDGGVGDPKLL